MNKAAILMLEPGKESFYKGSFEDCFNKYISSLPPKSMLKKQDRKPLVDFTGTCDITVARWVNGSRKILGENRLKVMRFLEEHGFLAEEYISLSKEEYVLSLLLVYQLYDQTELSEVIGFKHEDSLMNLFRKKDFNLSNEKKRKVAVLFNLNKEELIKRILEKRKIIEPPKNQRGTVYKDISPTEEAGVQAKKIVLKMIVHFVKSLAFLLEELDEEDFDQQDIKRFKESIGERNIAIIGKRIGLIYKPKGKE